MAAQIPASHIHLLQADVATLGTIDSHGRPQLTALWFLAEDGKVRMSLNSSRRKTRNLQRNPACSVLIFEPGNLQRYVEIRGDARIEPDPDYAFADRVGEKYGADLRNMDEPGQSRVVVTVEPTGVHCWG
jgi:PPOX class probable F420-dependent enzyme